MCSRLFGLLVWMILSSRCTSAVWGADLVVDPVVLTQLRTTAEEDWQAIEREQRSFDVSFIYKTKYVQRDGTIQSPEDIHYQLAYDADRKVALLRMQSKTLGQGIQHTIANSRYDFRILAKVMTERGTLNHVHVADPLEIDPDFDEGLPTWDGRRCSLVAACRLGCTPLRDIVNSALFEPIEAVRWSEMGQERLRFSAKYLGEQGSVGRKGGIYTLVFDPSHNHRIMSWAIDVLPSRHEKVSVSYFSDNSISAPHETVYIVDSAGEMSEQTWTFDRPKPCTIPDAEFYLPHYGFSEAVLETLHPNPWPRWLLIGFGIVTIAIGAWLFRGRRQPAA